MFLVSFFEAAMTNFTGFGEIIRGSKIMLNGNEFQIRMRHILIVAIKISDGIGQTNYGTNCPVSLSILNILYSICSFDFIILYIMKPKKL